MSVPPSISEITNYLRQLVIKKSPMFSQEWDKHTHDLPNSAIERILDHLFPQAAASAHSDALRAMLRASPDVYVIRDAIGTALLNKDQECLDVLLPHYQWDKRDAAVLARALVHRPLHFNLVWNHGNIKADCILDTVQQFVNNDQPTTHLPPVVQRLSTLPSNELAFLVNSLSYTVFYACHKKRFDVIEQILMHWPNVQSIPDLDLLDQAEQTAFDNLKTQETNRRALQDLSTQLCASSTSRPKASKKI